MSHLYLEITASNLREIFSIYGEVAEVNKCYGWARIRFQNPDDAKRALQCVNRKKLGKENFEISDRELLEKFVRKLEVKSASSSRSGSSMYIHASDQRASNQRPSNQRASNQRPSNQRAWNQRPSNQRAWNHRASNQRYGNETMAPEIGSSPIQYEDLVKVFRKRRTNIMHLKKRLLNDET